MSEPVYDEDLVNLGYLKRVIEGETEEGRIARNYASQPVPPYYKGDTWIDGYTVYTCINTREIGVFQLSDWATESGAKEEAERKNKTYLVQPSNYAAGDTWILQSDGDHTAGKKGDMLISTVGRTTYNEDDWVNMLSYGNVTSINEILNKIYNSIVRVRRTKNSGVQRIMFMPGTKPAIDENFPSTIQAGDFWYDIIDKELFCYNVFLSMRSWTKITDEIFLKALEEASQSNIVDDGEIQVFYDDISTITTMQRGDICSYNNKQYRYNGTKWVEIYETNLKETIFVDDITERTTKIETDFGYFKSEVAETTSNLETVISQNKTEMDQTANAINLRVQSIETNGTNKVQTSMGYTFDNSGLNIDKEGDLTSSKIDNKAFTVKDKAQNKNVFFAGYVDDANSQYRGQTIVESTNLVVKNFLNIEGSSRFQPYTNPYLGGHGTGVFDIS